jgi:tRNA-Thr(GGU) m(6)t(6)A37 methyltransferase TsaA
MSHDEIRPGEKAADWPGAADAGLVFVGRIRTPWAERGDCPRQGSPDGPLCQIEIFEPWREALTGIAPGDRLDVLYWLDRARRDLVLQSTRGGGRARGTFALRSPVRPNPIGLSQVSLASIEGGTLSVRGLDCVDGTPLIDIKPERCHHGPAGGG